MGELCTVWVENSPDTLIDIAIKCCLHNLDVLLCHDENSDKCRLRDGITLPREICDRIIEICTEEMEEESLAKQRLFNLFQDTSRTRLSRVNLGNSGAIDDDMDVICSHDIQELVISKCNTLTQDCLYNINRLKSSLLSLIIGDSTKIFSEDADVEYFNLGELSKLSPEVQQHVISSEPHCNYILNVPRLRKLVVNGLDFPKYYEHFQYSLQNMQFLTYLDLSRCKNLGDLSYLANHKNLISLILYNVPDLETCIPSILTLKSLKFLDVSQARDYHVHYKNPNRTLRLLVENLEHLESLDISGTNLAGDRVQEREEEEMLENAKYNRTSRTKKPEDPEELATDIVGLKSRVSRPLEFLGLYNTAYQSCLRHHIPAKKISGDANEQQVLIAGQMYFHRAEIIQKVLSDLFHIFRFSSCDNTKLALDVLLAAMSEHMSEKHIQISGSASLFYIVKGEEKTNFNIKIKKKIIKILLDAMSAHVNDVTMLRNACLTLVHFKIPEDMLYYYRRLVEILLIVVAPDDQDEFVQRIGVFLLNSLACQVNGVQKQMIGDMGGITKMLQLITQRLENKICDEVMETAWSMLWNVTDETPVNCQRFLEGNGMTLFLRCLQTFPEKPELLRNMMGLLGNVAEVKEQRPYLMKEEYLTVFSDLLASKSDGIEVSYNAAGILSHIASDGPELWDQMKLQIRRDVVLNRMSQAIQSWSLNAKRNINYRSFEPILRLLSVEHTPEAQYWAIWALANLTLVYPEKYCSVLKEEGGIEMVTKLLIHHPQKTIRDLAKEIIRNCQYFFSMTRTEETEIEDPR